MKKQTISADEFCGSIDINKQTLAKHRSGVRICPRLVDMPEPFVVRPKLLWWVADIEAWVESKRTFRPAVEAVEKMPSSIETVPLAPTKRKVGRPTNAEKNGVV
ncbi:MAG: hypothetical protein HOP24_05500 [Sideroxydans sp.]|nr:hypothetical protein [Sideroxydans sp.]